MDALVSFRLEDDLRRALHETARALGMSKGQVIRLALGDWLRQQASPREAANSNNRPGRPDVSQGVTL